ncbi:hypothetical protein DPMN_070436, partial [Dreissena polymorpha]
LICLLLQIMMALAKGWRTCGLMSDTEYRIMFEAGAGEHYVALGYNRHVLERIVDTSAQVTWETDPPTSDDDLNVGGDDMSDGGDDLSAGGDDLSAGGDDLNAGAQGNQQLATRAKNYKN